MLPAAPAILLDYQIPQTAVRRTPRWLNAVLLSLLFPAAVVPFVSFTYDISPLSALYEIGQRISDLRDSLLVIALISAPFFAGIVIVFWQLRALIRQPFSKPERIFAFWTAGASTLLTLGFCGYGMWQMLHNGFDSEGVTFECIGLGVLLAGAVLLWISRRMGAGIDELASLAMNPAYLANAIICLVGFKDNPQAGWWLTLWCAVVMSGQTLLIPILAFRVRRRA